MSLFYNKITGLFERADASQVSREGCADETRTPAHWQSFLTHGWDGEPMGGAGLKDPYNLSPWVQRAIKHIALPLSQVPLEFILNGEPWEDAGTVAFWQAPAKGMSKNSRLSFFDTIEATVGWLSLKGEYFWILDDTWLPVRAAFRSPFVIAKPEHLRPIVDDGELIGWQYNTGRGVVELIPEQVVSSRWWNPEDDFRGSAPMTSAKQAAESDYAAGRFWKSLAEANGDLGDTVIAPNGISPEQEAQIIRSLRAKRAASKKGKYVPQFFVGDIKTEAAKIQSPDASAVNQRLQNRHEVFMALGVPPSFAEVTASYSVGSASDRFKLIEETCMPIGSKIAESIEVVEMRRNAGVRLTAGFRFKDHSTMQEVRREKMKSAESMHQRGVPWSVINDVLSLDLPEFAGWDKAWLPFNLQEVEKTQDGKTQDSREDAEDAAGVKAFEELEVLLKSGPCAVHGVDHSRAADGKPNKRWEKLMRTRAPYVKRIRVTVDRALFEARRETLANIAAAEAEEKMVRSGAFDFIFDIARFLELLINPIFKIVVDAHASAGAELLADDMGSDDPFIQADPNGIAWLQERKNFIRDAGTEVWEAIRDSLEEGLSTGESFAKLSERVREEFNGLSKTASMRIAVTETGIAFESGRHDAMIQAGAEWKEWLTSDDDRVRASHYQLNGKRVPMDEPFMVGGVPMMFPCDPKGIPSEIINCRCVHGPVDGPDASDIEGNNPSVPIPF
jgi:SPP1 gp7 family putative phage head morphogenesis protein